LRRQALAKAVEDAHARAMALAAAAGVSLGPVYSISESSGFVRPQPVVLAAKVAPAGGGDYEPGTMGVTADVVVVYMLKSGR